VKRIEEPIRWIDPRSGAPDEMRALLADAHDALDPTQAEVARLGALVAGSVAAAGAGASASEGKAAALQGGHALTKAALVKLVGALAVCGLGAGVVVSLRGHSSAPLRPPAEQSRNASPLVQQVNVAPEPASNDAEAVADVADELAPAAPAATMPAPGNRAKPVPLPHPSAAGASDPTPPPVPATVLSPDVATQPASPSPVPEAPQRESELELLARARAQITSDPDAALHTLDADRAEYEHGVLAQEREVLAIEALARLGRKPEAEARAAAFHHEFPGSAHWRRILVLLADDARTTH
jgi:hypothetical protein